MNDIKNASKNKFNDIADKAKKVIDDVSEKINDAIERGKKALDDFVDDMAKKGKETAKNIVDDIKQKYDDAKNKWNEFKEKAKNLWDDWKEKAKKAWEDFKDNAEKAWEDWSGHLPKKIKDWLELNREGKHHYYDPLVLDLDGDGIETLAHAFRDGSMFDFNADGLRNATGWVKSDDGILVFDRNNNGLVDNGAEVFGDSTVKTDGTTAQHGFDALSDLDDNHDGRIDALDTHFHDLKVA